MKMIVLAAAMAAAQPGATTPVPAPPSAAEAAITREAQAFMESYASDLIAGNRTAVADRYDRRGTHMVIGRRSSLETHATIAGIYADPRWTALPRFAWHDLMFIPAGPDSIVVAGRFSVQRDPAPEPVFYSYSNLLVRQDGQLRIRMEHETREPTPPPR